MTEDQARGAGLPDEEPAEDGSPGTSSMGSPESSPENSPENSPASSPENSPASSSEGSPASGDTGHPAVDEVLRTIERLDERPVEEHVAVFEQAHETLRRTLDDAGDAASDVAEGTPDRD